VKQGLARPRLQKLDDLFQLGEAAPQEVGFSNQVADGVTVIVMMPFDQLGDFPGHPFRLYEGERRADMIDSIRSQGILQPLIARKLDNGNYHILSGHNRKYCGIEAGLKSAPVIVKCGLSDEDAWVYVIETNLMQRSFADMPPSEKAAVIVAQHSKLFSQGKRNDIISELQILEDPSNYSKNETSSQIAKKFHSDRLVGEQYSLSKDTVARYLRIHKLSSALKKRLDSDEIPFIPAVTLSFLTEQEQSWLDKCLDLNGFKVDIRKADLLRDYSARGKLTEDKLHLILTGELGRPPKKNRTPTVKVSKTIFAKYFKPNQSAKEIQAVVENALEYYFAHQE